MRQIKDKMENILFAIIQALPERLIPSTLMNWLEQYTDKRIRELQMNSIRQQWTNVSLEKKICHIRQQDAE